MVSHFRCVRLFAFPRTVAHQAPLSMGFSRQEYWSGLPYPPPWGSSRPRDWTQVSCIGRWVLYHNHQLGSPHTAQTCTNICCVQTHVQHIRNTPSTSSPRMLQQETVAVAEHRDPYDEEDLPWLLEKVVAVYNYAKEKEDKLSFQEKATMLSRGMKMVRGSPEGHCRAVSQESRCFPGSTSGKEPACQCRRHKRCGFDPWVGKIPWRRTQQPTAVLLPGESHGQKSLQG